MARPRSAGCFKHLLVQQSSPDVVLAAGPKSDPPRVALTFDDGPWPRQTAAVVDALLEAGGRGTFFMLGENAEAYPDLVRYVADSGMLVGIHGMRHTDLRRLSPNQQEREILSGASAISDACGKASRWFRPAYGKLPRSAIRTLRASSLRAALWSVDSRDAYRPPADVIAREVLSRVAPGSVVLMHDGGDDREVTLAALALILDDLRQRGYRLVTLDEL